MIKAINELIVLLALIHPTRAYAQANFTEIGNSTLYSQYHASPKSKFRGTIIFQSGSGSSLKEWTENKTFFNCVKQYGDLFLYDRSRLGKSPPDFSISSARPITARLVNAKLIKLLQRNRTKAPYILVSHSYGGLYAGHFARKCPDLVAGKLMLDPVPSDFQYADNIEEQFEMTLAKTGKASSREVYELFSPENPRAVNTMTADSIYQQMGFPEHPDQRRLVYIAKTMAEQESS